MNPAFRWRILVIGIVLMLSAGSASAQPTLDSSAYTAQGRLSIEQSDSIKQYIEFYTNALSSAESAEAIGQARKKLTDPMKLVRANDTFKDSYSAQLITNIEGAGVLKSESALVRQNAMVIIGKSVGGYGVDAAVTGLRDESWQVRYWAAKSLGQMSRSQAGRGLDEARQRGVLGEVTTALQKETVSDIRAQLYQVLNGLGVSEARDVLIEALNRHVDHYASNGIGVKARAEFMAFRGLHSQMIQAHVADAQANLPRVKAYTTVAARYTALINRQVSTGIANDADRAALYDLLERCERAMNWGMEKYDEGKWTGREGPALLTELKGGNDDQFQFNVLQWVGGTTDGLLTTEKIEIEKSAMSITTEQ